MWWLCPNKCPYGCLHEYQQAIWDKVVRNYGCPYCCKAGIKKLCYHQSIEFLYPEISKQWHPTKNGLLKPSDVTPGSSRIVWWICPNKCPYGCIHEFEQDIYNRTVQNCSCPYCLVTPSKICYHQSLEFVNSTLAKQWHPNSHVFSQNHQTFFIRSRCNL